jgi:hypothetical protein
MAVTPAIPQMLGANGLRALVAGSDVIAVSVGGLGANLAATGGAYQVLKQTSTGGAVTVAGLVAADIPSLPASIITSGQVGLAEGGTGADLSGTGGAHEVLKQTSSGGAITVAALVAADIPSLPGSIITSGQVGVAYLGSGTPAGYVEGSTGAWTTLPVSSAFTLTNGEASAGFVQGTPVYCSGVGSAKRGQGNAFATSVLVGLSTAVTASSGTAQIQSSGPLVLGSTAEWDAVVTGGSGGLVAGTTYALDPANAGKLIALPNTYSTGQYRTTVGTAYSTLGMTINISDPIGA